LTFNILIAMVYCESYHCTRVRCSLTRFAWYNSNKTWWYLIEEQERERTFLQHRWYVLLAVLLFLVGIVWKQMTKVVCRVCRL